MRKLIAGFFGIACLLPLLAAAQEQSQISYAYATYFVCHPEGESRADEIIRTSFKPHYDAAVEHGDIQGWTWMQHFVGGKWRRVLVLIAGDINSLLDASGALGEIISANTPEAGRAFSAICDSHEDYIWQTVAGVGGVAITEQRGAAGFSTYMECDMAKEERADELVREVFAPIYNRHLGENGLTSWNWLTHNVGGEWRRALIMGASDHKLLMKKRAELIAEFGNRKVERAFKEFNEICGRHQDYMWDILIQTP